MTDATQGQRQPVLNHALACCYQPAHDGASTLGKMALAVNPRLPFTTIDSGVMQGLSTGEQYHQNDLLVLLSGSPSYANATSGEIAATLAQQYRQQGVSAIKALGGAFSVCIVDHQVGKVIAATDRFGQHPLYYALVPEGIVIGSSASAVLAHPEIAPELTAQGVYNYVYFHMVPSPDSVYQNVSKLPAAHYLTYSNGQSDVSAHWIPEFHERNNHDETTLHQQLKNHLRESVRNAGGERDQVGAFLSGGLDSSTVTGMLSEIRDDKAQAFSIGFSAEGYDEMAFARTTAEHFGVKLNEYYVTPEDVVAALPLVATSYDEPFGNSSALPAYFCAKMAREHGITHLLAGDGGDEFFAGNERYAKQQVFERYQHVPSFLRKGLLEPLINILPGAIPLADKARSYIDQANTPLPDRLQSYNFLHRHAANEIFSDDFLKNVNTERPLQLQRDIYQRPTDAVHQNRMLYLDWQYTLADNDLRKVSQMCALAGVNVSYPMLDDALVDFSCTIPSDMKLSGSDLRRFYKNALRGWLPDATINKSKHGFGLPFGVWMREYKPLRELAYDNLLKLKERHYLQADFIDHTIELHRSGHASYYGELVWILTVFELWVDAHFE